MAKKYNFFVEDFETPKAELGSGFIQSYLGGGLLSKGFAVATERRIYFKGKSYFKDYKGHWKKQMQEKTVDLKDVTGTGYTSMRQLWMLIAGIVSVLWFILWGFSCNLNDLGFFVKRLGDADILGWIILFDIIPASIFLALYFLKRRTLFSIEFAGGSISFNTSWYSKTEVDKFQMDLRKAMAEVKDIPVSQATIQVQSTPQSKDKAETLREYAKLKDDGIITDDEFQKMKGELLSSDNK